MCACGHCRVPLASGAVRPHCAVRIRALYGPELARSKMGYNEFTILLIRAFRPGRDPLQRLARPPGPPKTSDRFCTPRKSLLSPDITKFCTSHFPIFSKLRKKGTSWPKPRFRLFRGRFRPEAGPAGIRECFHSIRKLIYDISISEGVT